MKKAVPDRPECFDTRPLKDGTRRRRYRRADKTRFTTIELPIEELNALRIKAFKFERLRLLLTEEMAPL